jgi:hypothetical protein
MSESADDSFAESIKLLLTPPATEGTPPCIVYCEALGAAAFASLPDGWRREPTDPEGIGECPNQFFGAWLWVVVSV